MYIDPNTTIIILKDVPLDLTYDHTIWFPPNGQATQAQYFESKKKYRLDRQSYQRVKRGWMRVNIKAENLYDCNYLMFRNTAFGEKWFYAFIKSVEYINHSVSEIEFQLDVMQTWYFDYTLEQSLVEREHQATDDVGDNLVPESLETGEYIVEPFDGSGAFVTGWNIVVAATFRDGYTPVGGAMYSGIFSGLYYNVFDDNATGLQQVVDFINNAGNNINGIVSVFMIPKEMVTQPGVRPNARTISKTKSITTIDGYTPKNKKLLTYPYNFMYVTNYNGESKAFPFEYFDSTNCQFDILANFTANPSAMLVPRNYKGSLQNFDEGLLLDGFPQCSFNTDSYKAWLAQTAAGLPYRVATDVLGAGTTIANSALNPLSDTLSVATSQLTNLASKAFSLVGQVQEHRTIGNTPHGTGNSSVLAAFNKMDFFFACKHIRAEFARIIDDYFTIYGYACHRVKVPNTNVRPHWTYTKTVGCKIVSSMPADDAKTVCDIFDHGITFWVNGSEVGNYSLDNSPT